jgi:CheY-like chemotaxis protein
VVALDPRALLDSLPAGEALGATPEAAAAALGGRRILIAEDNKTNRFLLRSYLTPTGATLHFAEDGVEALARFDANLYDAVIMDVSMPKMDGLEATLAIREREAKAPERQPVAILGLTANAFDDDRDRCLAAGMTRFMSKPIRRTELIGGLGEAIEDTPELVRRAV